MKTTDDIFWLIKSLNRNEKTYFKKFAGIHVLGEGNNYVRLFDYIDSMKSYNEKLIINAFKDEKFIRQLSVAKNYLYNAILRSLKVYKKSDLKRDEVKGLLEDISILYEKRLFEQAKKLLKKSKKISESHEFYSELILILIWELKIVILEREYDEKTERVVNENYRQRKEILKAIDNMFDYDKLDFNISSHLVQHPDVNSRLGLSKLEKIISSALLQNEDNALTTTAKLKFMHIHATYYYAIGDMHNCYLYLSREVNLIKSKVEMFNLRLQDYFILLTNLMIVSIDLGKFDKFREYINEIRGYLLQPRIMKNEVLKFYIIYRSYLIEMLYCNHTGDFQKTLMVYNDILGILSELGKKLSKTDEFECNFSVSYAYFGISDFDNALNYLNKILNDPEAESRYGNYSMARIYLLIIHFELGNMDLIEYLIRSVYRHLVKKEKLHRFEKLMFSFLKRLTGVNTQKELNSLFREILSVLNKNSAEPSFKNALRYFDFRLWLESKLNGLDFGEIIKLKLPTV